MLKRSFLLLVVWGISISNTYSQNSTIDSLKNVYITSKNDVDKANALVRITFFYLYVNIDSSEHYANLCKKLSESINYHEGIANTEINIGNIYNLRGNYNIAMQHFLKAISIGEEHNIEQTMVWGYANIGIIYLYQRKYDLAIEYTKKSLEHAIKIGDVESIGNSYNNLGEILNYQKKYDEAIIWYKKSLQHNIANGNSLSFKAMNLLNIGDVYLKTQVLDSASYYFTNAQSIAQQIGDSRSLAICQYGIAKIDSTNGNYSEAIRKATEGLENAQKIGSIEEIRNISRLLYGLSKKLNKPVDALKYFEIYSNANNTIFNLEKSKEIVELQAEYDINQKNKEIELQNEKLKKQKIFLTSSILVISLLILLAFQLFFYQRRVKRANQLLTKQKDEILLKNALITSQKDEIEAQRDEIVLQKSVIELKNKNLTDSISYAQRIQGALLGRFSNKTNEIKEHFIFYKPKDIVSGDFYYIRETDDYLVFAAADCTGHGVPGAFMSMLGITLLDEIFAHTKPSTAAEVLEELRIKVKAALNQTIIHSQTRDGMDIALCLISKKTKQLQYAGAYQPLLHIRNGEMAEYKGTRCPVEIHIKEFPFENYLVNTQPNDVFMIFSDGFADQIGGLSKQKLKLNEFKKILVEFHSKPFAEIPSNLEKRISEWRSNNDQTDDILVMGFKL